MNKNNQNKLVPKLRFPEFVNDGEWDFDTAENLISTISPPKKLNSSEYLEFGKFPIVDQSQKFYCGWTNDREALIKNDFPLIIFGDHTCILKLVNEPFAQGADGIKIIKPNKSVTTEYLYHFLYLNGVQQENYKRHFSILKDKVVLYPDIKTGEQQKIASCLSSLDEVIKAENQKLEVLKDHKKGLLQNLFPQEGETVPKLRFKEFENSGEWVEKTCDDTCKFIRGPFGGALKKEIFVSDGFAVYEQSHAIYGNFSFFRYFITEEKYNELKRFSIQPNDIIMSCSGTMGKFAIIPKQSKKGVINQALLKLTVKSGYDTKFIKTTLELPLNQNKLLSQSAGGAIKNVVEVAQIKKIKLLIPSINEQKRISSFIISIDDLINAQSQKIETLKLHKKGLLQGLFPGVNET